MLVPLGSHQVRRERPAERIRGSHRQFHLTVHDVPPNLEKCRPVEDVETASVVQFPRYRQGVSLELLLRRVDLA